jgi:copper ion binding protein
METLTLQIEGMSCGHCVTRVEKTLSRIEGVDVGKVEVGAAELRYDPARVEPARILEAIDDLGFQPQVAGASV